MTIIKQFTTRSRHFTIIKDENDFYCAIEDKYITDGKLNTTLNGFQMYANKDLNKCLNSVVDAVEVDHLVKSGYSKAEAFAIHWNLPLDKCRELFAR